MLQTLFIFIVVLLSCWIGYEVGKETKTIPSRLRNEVEQLVSIYFTGNNLDSTKWENCEIVFTRNDVVSMLVSALATIDERRFR